MKQLQLPVGYSKQTLGKGEAGEILPCPAGRRGNTDVYANGGPVFVRGGDYGSTRLQIFGPSPLTVVEGIRMDKNGQYEDGIDFAGSGHETAVVRKCRIMGVSGAQAETHGDAVQVYNGTQVDTLLIEDCTFGVGYQAVMTTESVRLIILRRVNVINQFRKQARSKGILRMSSPKGRPCLVVLEDVWFDGWPAGDELGISGPTTVIGKVNIGTPPGGDFCPAFPAG